MFAFLGKNRTEPVAPVAAPTAAPYLENPPTKAAVLGTHNPAVPRQPLGPVSNIGHPVC